MRQAAAVSMTSSPMAASRTGWVSWGWGNDRLAPVPSSRISTGSAASSANTASRQGLRVVHVPGKHLVGGDDDAGPMLGAVDGHESGTVAGEQVAPVRAREMELHERWTMFGRTPRIRPGGSMPPGGFAAGVAARLTF